MGMMPLRRPVALVAFVVGTVAVAWLFGDPTLPPGGSEANPAASVAVVPVQPPGQGAPAPWRPGGYGPWSPTADALEADLASRARALADMEYVSAGPPVPDLLAALDFDGYRQIRFRPERALWRPAPFEVQLFHLGGIHVSPVGLHLVENGTVRTISYDPDLFTFEGRAAGARGAAAADLSGFAGFRLHHAVNRPGVLDEVAAFLGASYFRVLSQGQEYGLSARGIAVDPAVDGPEEFPAFREFWIERPRNADGPVVVHALLDGPSLTGAYRFDIAPGAPTRVEVTARLFARADIRKLGVAPMSSMFLHAPGQGPAVDDFRPRVHDSDGLLAKTGEGEWIWRPLDNGPGLHVTSLRDRAPAGFGLVQRAREFSAYLDLEARYHLRPSYWIEVLDGDWGSGGVELLEIPSESEFEDNVAVYWVPDVPLRRGEERTFRYRLVSTNARPDGHDVAWVERTAIGWDALPGEAAPPPRSRRRIVVDFLGGPLAAMPDDEQVRTELTVSAGRVEGVTIQPLPGNTGRRVTFALTPDGAAPADMRLRLWDGERPVSETWSYVWYPLRID